MTKTARPGHEPVEGGVGGLGISKSILDFLDSKDAPETNPPIGWPKKLWVLEYSVEDSESGLAHGIIVWGETHGLGVFRKKDDCLNWAIHVKNPPSRAFRAVKMTFEEAEKIARGKKEPINSMILAGEPAIIYWLDEEE